MELGWYTYGEAEFIFSPKSCKHCHLCLTLSMLSASLRWSIFKAEDSAAFQNVDLHQ